MTKKEIPKDPQKVARIMQAACHAFATAGYRGAKTDVIAADADVSKGLIFHYYGSKQGLYVATIQHTTQVIIDTIDPAIYDVPADLVDMIVRGTKYKSDFGRSHPDEMRLLINAYGESAHLPAAVQKQMRALYDQTIATSRQMIRNVLKQMPLRPELDEATVVDLIVGVYNQVFSEFQAHMAKHHDAQSMADVQWVVERAKAYMEILEHGFVQR
ncbi:TetR/AcrR family transcriptional regulator [Lactiplantibacillus plajomi]|uniref:TetR/AcrR family transcriptional regulator n=1 Tax=Lactiplantibacillus plajomi TaxID=1457217 RepID=A0ABV6K6W9_9LACO|nr:TetR/AcrR family transcriptional regulator [Lactiplantibacillus plajomi]